ncbi:MAG: lipopolysaccharide biosynthesis protein [Pseudomonadota bacterium]
MSESKQQNVGAKVVSGFRWLALGRLASQAGTWVVTLVVIRLLAPEDYGLMAMATMVIGFFALFEEFGMGAALTQRSELEEGVAGKVFGVVITTNACAALVLLAIAAPVARFFEEPRLVDIIHVLTLRFPLLALISVPQAMLARRMQFKRKATVEFLAMITGSLVSLGLALSGAGVWALVWGSVGATIVRATGMNLAVRFFEMPRFSLRGMREVVTFGGQLTVNRILWYFYAQADVFVIGRLLGKEVLGVYAVAMQLAKLPMQKLGAIVNEVGFAGFSRLQSDREEIARQFVRAASLISVFAFPVFFGISSVAPELVLVVLGPGWTDAILPLQLLSLVCPIRMLNQVLNSALLGVGRADLCLRNTVVLAVVLPLGFVFGARYGLAGVCWVWLLGFSLCFGVILLWSLPVLGVAVMRYLGATMGVGLSATAMWGSVTLAREGAEAAGFNAGLMLLLALVVTGAAAFALLAFTLHRSSVDLVLRLVRR